ncbi:MAG: acetyltransferase [Chloroflexi bacterium]|nr:acetyltransferase [Chloroflexota bacterium]
MHDLIVFGGGGHAKVVIGTARAAGYQPSLVIEANPSKWGQQVMAVLIAGDGDLPTPPYNGVIAIGANHVRQKLNEHYTACTWQTLLHPSAIIDESSQIGAGTVVFAGAVIQPEVSIGRHVVINTSATVDHDCRIGDYVHIAPGTNLAGSVEVGEGTLIGIGSAVLPGVKIGSWSIIGAGAIVTASIPARSKGGGVPARVI